VASAAAVNQSPFPPHEQPLLIQCANAHLANVLLCHHTRTLVGVARLMRLPVIAFLCSCVLLVACTSCMYFMRHTVQDGRSSVSASNEATPTCWFAGPPCSAWEPDQPLASSPFIYFLLLSRFPLSISNKVQDGTGMRQLKDQLDWPPSGVQAKQKGDLWAELAYTNVLVRSTTEGNSVLNSDV
jgi:hypothetical protein